MESVHVRGGAGIGGGPGRRGAGVGAVGRAGVPWDGVAFHELYLHPRRRQPVYDGVVVADDRVVGLVQRLHVEFDHPHTVGLVQHKRDELGRLGRIREDTAAELVPVVATVWYAGSGVNVWGE